jgi:hypothetical protein
VITIQPDWSAVIGLIVTIVLGFGVGPLVRRVGASIGPLPPPSPETAAQWKKLSGQQTGGAWIGRIERVIFFASLWITGAWPVLSSWLVFKLAFYWQSANLTAFPDSCPNQREADYLVAKRTLGTHYIATALVGTGASIVAALAGVVIGKWITFR